jgi:hypothetical protein
MEDDEQEWFDPDDDETTERCDHCGKPFEEFGDLGCKFCDARVPGFGVLPG